MATVDTQDYTIDIIRHAASGERFVARICSLWTDEEVNQDCIGYQVVAMAGPLTDEQIGHLRANPEDWDEDRGFDLDGVTIGYRADGEWREVEELYAGHR